MGDILHTLPAVADLRASLPHAEIAWAVEPKWIPILQTENFVHHLLPVNRRDPLSVWIATKWLRRWQPDLAIDFQGLIKSAAVTLLSGAPRRLGYAAEDVRERSAAILYNELQAGGGGHIVDRHRRLASFGKAVEDPARFPLPEGFADSSLPENGFVLAAPFAGWGSKQWPIENYALLGERLRNEANLTLVLNVAPGQAFPESEFLFRHQSSLEGLIDATRRARAVLGLDSGPMHLAAALAKPGVALFGPTDPARNGPYGGTIRTLRIPGAQTSYKRSAQAAESMRQLSVDMVWNELLEVLA
jgi:heptosyltransferase I